MENNTYKTRAVVLHTMQHGETGHIVFMYTEAFGRVSYYVNSGKRGVATVGGNRLMLHPLTVIDIVGASSKSSFHKIREAKRVIFSTSLLTDIYKSAISLFLSEFLYRALQEEGTNPMLFDYLFHSIKILDTIEEGKGNFHLYFIVHLTKYMGFYPNNNFQEEYYFDMTTGNFVIIKPTHSFVMDRDMSALLWSFMNISMSEITTIKSSGKMRSGLLDKMVSYIGLHQDTKYTIKSLEYLKEIF